MAADTGAEAPDTKQAEEAPIEPQAAEPGTLEALSEAIESGAGLTAAARAAAGILGASVALIDRSGAVLTSADATPADEHTLIEAGKGVVIVALRVADAQVGELRYRARGGDGPNVAIGRMIATLLALEVERARGPEWASEEASAVFVSDLLDQQAADPDDLIARAGELGIDLSEGGGVLIVRAGPRSAQDGDWRGRILSNSLRAVRSVSSSSAATLYGEAGSASRHEGGVAEVAALLPVTDPDRLSKAAKRVEAELADSHPSFSVTIATSRIAESAGDLFRAGKEAMLAANVAEAEDRSPLAFEDTGSYRLLLGAVSDDPDELKRFYAETIAPIVAYDQQYETDLLLTAETYLECDGGVTPTADRLFTHRHTVRYRLERIREIAGHDMTSTEGREQVGLGLKTMRVLGIAAPRGPAHEARSGGKLPKKR